MIALQLTGPRTRDRSAMSPTLLLTALSRLVLFSCTVMCDSPGAKLFVPRWNYYSFRLDNIIVFLDTLISSESTVSLSQGIQYIDEKS